MIDQQTADARKVAFKAKLLTEQIGLAAGLAATFAPRVHMIKAGRPGRAHRIQLTDGGWIEIDPETRRVVTWGPGRTARDLATAIAADDDAYAIEHLEKTSTAAAPGAPRRSSPILSDEQAKSIADGWRARGYGDVTEDARGVWVVMPDGTRLFDVGDRIHIHGRRTDEVLIACVAKAKSDWDGGLMLTGPWPAEDEARLWLECQRQGVRFTGYEPSAELVARWEAEQEARGRSTGAALRPSDASAPVSAGPVPPASGAATTREQEPDAPAEPVKPDADTALARNVDRVQADLDALYERWAHEARTEEARDRLRQEEETLTIKLAIYERARKVAREKGLSREDAIHEAYAEVERERGYEPNIGLHR